MDVDPTLRSSGLCIDFSEAEVLLNGAPVLLSPAEHRLLWLLTQNPGVVFTRPEIIRGVHGDDYPATDRSVDTLMVGLRKKLASAGRRIETIRGEGYRFRGDAQ